MVLVDLAKEVKKRLDEGCEILICIDANEQMNDKKSRIQEFEVDLGLIDIAAERDDNTSPTYTTRKTARRIYMFLGTTGVASNVTAYGIAPDGYGNLLEEHRPQFIDIKISTHGDSLIYL